MCCAWLAENTAHKKSPSGHRPTTLSGYIFAIKARINNWKNLLSTNISPMCPHNMVNFGPLAAEIDPVVWGTPANFNGFLVLAALLHDTLVFGVSHTAALNRGRHLYSAGRPSRWALAHILVLWCCFCHQQTASKQQPALHLWWKDVAACTPATANTNKRTPLLSFSFLHLSLDLWAKNSCCLYTCLQQCNKDLRNSVNHYWLKPWFHVRIKLL